MNRLKFICLFLTIPLWMLPAGHLFGQKNLRQRNIRLKSPDGSILFSLQCKDDATVYSVHYKGQSLIGNSALSLSFEKDDLFGRKLRIDHAVFSKGEDNYELPAGKTSKVVDTFNEVNIPLHERDGKKRILYLRVRAFNDGLAFRYEFPVAEDGKDLVLLDENTTFNLSGNPFARAAFLENFTTSHEHHYQKRPFRDIGNDTLMDMPALFEFRFPGRVWLAITEANLVDYAGMSLIKHNGILSGALSPLPGQGGIKVRAKRPHHSPWRVLLISDRIGALIESNLLTSLSEPCKIQDLSWLKPGKASFHWWNGDSMPDTTFEPGVNFDFNKYYIDFCARNGLEYHTVIGYRGVAWYQNDGIEYQPGPNTDVTKPRPGLDIQAICDYAKTKGVGIRFWVHWKALYPKLDTAFTLFQKWGIRGMMVDFMDRDDQEMVRIQEEILQKAAEHHLEIQFHGAFKPTGLSRTYPNESTREGALNYEYNKGGNFVTPDDDIDIPFTRLLAGPTDYHLGGFRALPAARMITQYTRPFMLGTRCHMLAMYVILENHLSMVCDYPDAYEGQDGFDFLKEVPTVWDQTRVPGAEPGKWVTIARRKGADWYVGTITNGEARDLTIPLRFLAPGNYKARLYSDAPDSEEHPNKLVETTKTVNSSDSLTIHLAAGGGQVIRLSPSF